MVRELAKEIYPSLLFGNDTPAYHPRTPSQLGMRDEVMADRTANGKRLGSMKRSTSDNAPVIPPMVEEEKGRAGISDLTGGNREKERGMMVRGKTVGMSMSPVKDVNVRELPRVRGDGKDGDAMDDKATVREARTVAEDAAQRHRRKASSRGNVR